MSRALPKRIEEAFGGMKATGRMRRSRFRGAERTDTARNLLRLVKPGFFR